MNKPLCFSLKMFRAVIGSHKIYSYITLHQVEIFSPCFSMMLPPRKVRIFASLARWQLYLWWLATNLLHKPEIVQM